jgi:hypothetical protein
MSSNLDDRGTGSAPRPPRPDYEPKWHIEPQTLDDLMKRAGPYAEAAKAFVEWGAVSNWLTKVWPNPALAAALIPDEAANLSVLLTRKAVEHETGWPQLSDRAVTPALYDLPDDAQGIARRMAVEVHALWGAAGRPYLDTRRFKDAFRWLVACIRSGSIPPVPTIGDVPPLNS